MSENNEGIINTSNDGVVEGTIDRTAQKYIKISPTFHVSFLSGSGEHEIYRIFNPQTGTVEERELTDNEKHEIIVKELKKSKIKFRYKNQFGAEYRKKRKHKKRAQKASRRINRASRKH
jgi:hypothetical protein